MSEHPSKQKIVDKLKDSDTVLVTVSSSPSVDELSAALGFTLLLNKMNKHATAVFSGDVPPAITFLDPEKTFENTVDSLRDFIIALDKERADHLRYKVEGDMVKIFITPYRTTIGKEDFEFSQGDYNVEMVVAIGVDSEDDLDKALADHGRILHDATVASLSVGDNKSALGTINWHEDNASSYCEMLVSIADALKGSKNPIDEQIATAFLTGIVAATERFSNTKTTSNAMTMAASLMAAGANQQLIATKLEEAEERVAKKEESNDTEEPSRDDQDNDNSDNSDNGNGSMLKVQRDEDTAQPKQSNQGSRSGRKRKKHHQSDTNQPKPQQQPKPEPVKDKPAADGSMSISHEMEGSVDQVAAQVARENQAKAADHAEEKLADSLAMSESANAVVPSVADLKQDLARASEEVDQAASGNLPAPTLPPTEPVLPAPVAMPTPAPKPLPAPAVAPDMNNQPRMGGTLNATSEQAADDKRRELEKDRNKTILSHDTGGYLETERKQDSPSNASHGQAVSMTAEGTQSTDSSNMPADASQRGKTIMPPSASTDSLDTSSDDPSHSGAQQSANAPTLADIDSENRGQDDARSQIEQALEQGSGQGVSLAPSVASASLPPLPPMPDFSTLPELPPTPSGEADAFIQTPLPHQQPQGPQSSPFNQPAPAQPQQSQQPSQQAAPHPQQGPSPFNSPQPVFSQPNQAQFQPPVSAQAEAHQEQNLTDRLGDILPPAQPQQSQQPSQSAPQPQKTQDPAQFQLPN